MFQWFKKYLPNRHELFKNYPYLHKFQDFLERGNAWRLNVHAVACGVAVGIFAAFIPLPIQTILAIFLAILLRGNILIAVAATWVSNPITFAPIVYLIYSTGNWVLRNQEITQFSLQPVHIKFSSVHVFLQSTLDWVTHYGKAFFVGLPIISLTAAVSSYLLILLSWQLINFLKQFRKKKREINLQNDQKPWHSFAVVNTFHLLNTHKEGLTDSEAARRLKIYGFNTVRETKKRGPLIRFLEQFNNLIVYVLLAAAVISVLLKHWLDMSVILGVVLLDAIIGIIQEGKAEKALEAIRHMLSLHTIVIREGKYKKIPAKNLVKGDVVLIKTGDKVPADLRLFKTHNLQIQESILTGESLPVEKSSEVVAAKTELGDRSSMAYSGTYVIYGKGLGVVVACGDQTETGQIGLLVSGVTSVSTPLLVRINKFSRLLTFIILLIATFTFLFGVLIRNYNVTQMFMAAVSIAVAAIPEGLPAIITIILAVGVTRMAKRHAIVRRLPAVETLGSVSVICTDKTGTLTPNELTVENIVLSQTQFVVTGAGLSSAGEIKLNDEVVVAKDHADLYEAILAALLCNDAELTKQNGQLHLLGNPIDGALLNLGLKAKFDIQQAKKLFLLKDILPFESENKLMATLYEDSQGKHLTYVKGAPEKILQLCDFERLNQKNIPLIKESWLEKIEELAKKGKRIIAIAFHSDHQKKSQLEIAHLNHLTLLAIFGLEDSPTEETISAIAECQSAGIRIKMITGDYPATAKSVATQLNLANCQDVLSGADLDKLNTQDLKSLVNQIDIYARTSPFHKLKLVEALQANEQVVAMTGDGVNDAPALKRADIGVAMGKKGTEVAKESAEIVLADDNFTSIAAAVKEGRTVYDNLRKTMLFVIPTDGAEALIIVIAILFGWTLPITPLQILWINMVTAVTLGFALAFEPAEKNIMQHPPIKKNEAFFSKALIWRSILVAILMLTGAFGLFVLAFGSQTDLDVARTIVVNTIVIGEIAYLLNLCTISIPMVSSKQKRRQKFFAFFFLRKYFPNKAILLAIISVILLQLFFSYVPFMQKLFNTANLNCQQWSYIWAFGVLLFLLVEVEKFVTQKISLKKLER